MNHFSFSAGPGLKIVESRLIAVLVVHSVDDGLSVADALLRGGVDVMELTLRTPAALDALRAIRERLPDMTAGVGTILKSQQVDAVVQAGGSFGVSPGVNEVVIRRARERGLPFAPGIMTPSDLDRALVVEGCELLKFFPAESAGGLAHLRNMSAPYAHLNPRFVPLGGIHRDNLRDYLRSPLIAAVGGSWLASRELIEAKAWDQIEQNAAEACRIVAEIRAESH